jgi:hypothetical protein
LAKKEPSRLKQILTSSTAPWALIVTAVVLVAASALLPLVKSKDAVDELFRVALLVGIAEALLALYVIVWRLENRDTPPELSVEILQPPHSINQQLLDLAVEVKSGSLVIICYGSNRFGKVLDTVAERLSSIKTNVLVCEPAYALHPNDEIAIADFVSDMDSVDHVTISTTPIIPTIRAAVLRDAKGVPIWASVSFYLVQNSRRALRSEGRSPVVKIDDARSRAMPVVVDFIDQEFARLAGATPS